MLLKDDRFTGANEKDGGGMTPLHYAVERRHSEIVMELLKDSRVNVNLKNNKGQNVLHIAYNRGSSVVTELLKEARLDLNEKNKVSIPPPVW